MPFDRFGTPPAEQDCTDLGRLPMGLNTPHDAPGNLAGKPIPDSARIREAVYLMQRKGTPHMAQIQLKKGLVTIYVGPDGWAVHRE